MDQLELYGMLAGTAFLAFSCWGLCHAFAVNAVNAFQFGQMRFRRTGSASRLR
jgi:hypothetical protein